ncbi:probable N-acetyltransferase 8B [Dromaius novaehollandiae]|uniref:probable N-acetyltransferase 8B n=1 Tax=Dromaius novaehollandiae TaxID=8790 RepID=UPI00311DD9A3
MAQFRIRQYRDEDYEVVRTLYACGIMEHVPAVYRHFLRSWQAQLGLLGLVAVVRAAAGGWVPALGAAALALLGTWLLVRSFVAAYVRDGLGTDLRNIRAAYLRAPGSGFWVAEAGGAVVGTVAAVPAPEPAALELKRMSVRREQRGRGVARALAREVLGFARARGYGAVVLETSMVQVAAQRLYEGQGFRKVGAFSPSLLGRLLCVQMLRYRCELPAAPGAPLAPPGRPADPAQ